MFDPPVTLVTTSGTASMDRYGQQLAGVLRTGRLHVDLSALSADRFGRPPAWSALRADAALVRRLRATTGLLHLTHHHLARYALALRRDQPYVVTSHDLIRWYDLTGRALHIARPHGLGRLGLHLDYVALRRAAHVVAPSTATRTDLLRHLGLAPERVTVVPEGIDHELFRPVPPRPVPWPYVLFVGSEHPRKNLAAVLRAFALLKSRPATRDLRLVKVGAAGDGEERFRDRTAALVRELGLEREVVFAGVVPDAELPGWYSGAGCLLMPSHAEGFGLPPLEAMACGTPVVVSTAGSLPEVTGGAALLVEPDDVPGLAGAVERLLHDEPLRTRLRQQGRARAGEFTWERAARETQRVYERVLGARPELTAR